MRRADLRGRRNAPPRLAAGLSDLALRAASGVLLAAIALVTAVIGSGWLAAVWAIAGALAAAEWVGITKVEPRRALLVALPALVAVAGLAAALEPAYGLLLLAAGLGLVAWLGRAARDCLWAAGGLLAAGVLALVPPVVRSDGALGFSVLLWMFAVVWTTDVAAYFVGRSLGGPKLWPRVSPKKTWSGAIGGTVAGTGAGVLVLGWLAAWPSSLGVILASGAASVVSQAGDLAESALKRHFGAKDSGRTIPGHGGFMDRLDGFWAVSLLVGVVILVRGGAW